MITVCLVWKWVSEVEPKSVFDLRFAEGSASATITATLDRTYSEDVVITLLALQVQLQLMKIIL